MQFKEGDKVQFIREGSLIDGVVKEVKDWMEDNGRSDIHH